MINFNYELDFALTDEAYFTDWITRVIDSENFQIGDLNYIFCSDEYLLQVNLAYLNHDYYTDIITFDYCEAQQISGDIFISIDRVRENAKSFAVSFNEELLRVMAHGLLHLMKYKDKTDEDSSLMRRKENEKIKLFHVEP